MKSLGPHTLECVVGETIRPVRILAEAEWEAIPPGQKPSPAEYFPGLGWVFADARRTR